ncbi:MAG: PAS domain-containing protein [Gammaproteobacteria bacterium]
MTKEINSDIKPGPPLSSPPCSMHEVDPAYMGLTGRSGRAETLGGAELARLGAAVLSDIPDAVVFSDREGLIRFWNASAERIFGFSHAEAMGESLDIIIPERLRQRHWDGYYRMMQSGKAQHPADELLAVPALSKSGEPLSIQFTVAPVKNTEGALVGIVAVMRDVTATYAELRHLRR